MEVEEHEEVEDAEEEDSSPKLRLARKVANFGMAAGRYYTPGRMNSEEFGGGLYLSSRWRRVRVMLISFCCRTHFTIPKYVQVSVPLPHSAKGNGDFPGVRRFTGMTFFCLFVLLTFAPGAHAQNMRTIFLVRHADKVSDETDSPLSEQGRRRAECLANTLADAQIQQIFTSELQRTQQTAAPLAEKLHLKPVAIPLSRPDKLVEAIRSDKAANVLVVWHDATLPEVLRALGAPAISPIAHTEYDRFFILTLSGEKTKSQPRFTALRYCDCTK
jgi:phosphohistidine phosphatase SixA